MLKALRGGVGVGRGCYSVGRDSWGGGGREFGGFSGAGDNNCTHLLAHHALTPECDHGDGAFHGFHGTPNALRDRQWPFLPATTAGAAERRVALNPELFAQGLRARSGTGVPPEEHE